MRNVAPMFCCTTASWIFKAARVASMVLPNSLKVPSPAVLNTRPPLLSAAFFTAATYAERASIYSLVKGSALTKLLADPTRAPFPISPSLLATATYILCRRTILKSLSRVLARDR
jgi:hypothetical protein